MVSQSEDKRIHEAKATRPGKPAECGKLEKAGSAYWSRMKLEHESLILAQDERWRRA